MTEETSVVELSVDTKESNDESSEMVPGTHFATKPDGSLIDLSNSEGEGCLVGELSMPDGTSAEGPQDPVQKPVETQDSVNDPAVTEDDTGGAKFVAGSEGQDTEGEVIEEQVLGQKIEEPLTPLTPVTDHFDVPKSLPESGTVTPASQSDQSLTFSSSEKGTPNTKLKVGDVRHLDYDSMSSSSGSVKNLQLPQRAGISWRKGERLEAMDYLNTWFPAKIRSINEDDMQVLIHFDGWNQRYDEWIDMSSDRIRPLVRHSERKEKSKRAKSVSGERRSSATKKVLKEHKIGDAVYAKWTDCKMYPAKITNIMPSGTYEVIFYDGFKKLVQPINVRSMPNEYRQKSFEINPVPEVVLKKAKMKLDTTDTASFQQDTGNQEVKSCEKMKIETIGRESSAEREKKQSRAKKRRLVVPGLFSEGAVSGLPENVTPELQIKSEPVSTQTDYGEGNKMDTTDIKVERGTSAGPVMAQPQPLTPVVPVGVLPPKAFVVESDHNQYKCQYEGCNKGFRKEHLLDYHIKYYHISGGPPQPPPAKRRRKTTSTCSTESESIPGGKKLAAKKIRNFSAEGAISLQDMKSHIAESQSLEETGEISTQTAHGKHADYTNEDFMYGMKQDSMEESSVTDAEDFLKPDELVNCICDFQEENGLMIQCEVCMCWQHAACFGITERTLPKTYVCFVCENPPGVRDSSRYIHEQDWFKTGEIASFNFLPIPPMSEERCNTVKSTHTLVVEIQQLNAVLHSLKLQLKILRTKDESKLKMWRVDWDTVETDTIESFGFVKEEKTGASTDGLKGGEATLPEKQTVKSEVEKEVKAEIKTEIKVKETSGDKTENEEIMKSNLNENEVKVEGKEEELHNATTSEEVLNKTPSTDTPDVKTTDNGHKGTNSEAQSMLIENSAEIKQEVTTKILDTEEENHSDSTESVVEDPMEVCEKNLLSHILRVQAEISDRFDKIQEQIEMLEAMEAMQSRREPPTAQNVLNDMPNLKRSIRNMENDLCKIKKMSVFH